MKPVSTAPETGVAGRDNARYPVLRDEKLDLRLEFLRRVGRQV